MIEDNFKLYNATIDKLEELPEFRMDGNDLKSLKLSAIVSIAISLKRIADRLSNEKPKTTAS